MALSSMTGFGRCELEEDGRRIVVELKSVNNRYLDINIRLPRTLSVLEETVRAKVKEKLARGRVDVSIFYENLRQDAKTATVDQALLKGYLEALQQIRQATGRADDVTLTDLIRLPDLVTLTVASEDMDALTDLLGRAVDGALDQITAMRQTEGRRLGADVEHKLATVEGYLAQVEERAPCVVEEYRARLTQRIGELLDQIPVDEGRLANEVAVFSDRCSIAEELTRLHSHIAQTRQMLQAGEPVGRKLDFIVQEFNREVNTICSKANDLTITAAGLSMKNEIEKIREQVQNIE